MSKFWPSQVFLNEIPPLVGTMGRSEIEHAAALLVRACQVRGDVWAPVAPTDMGAVLTRDLESDIDPWRALDRNRFFNPNFDALVERGFAKRLDDGRGHPRRASLAFTEKGIEALRKYVQPKGAPP